MFDLSLPWWESPLRAALVYIGVLVMLRVLGKRQFGELGPFDIILLLLISEAASNAMVADEFSLTWAAMLIATMLAIDWAVGKLAQRSSRVGRAVEGEPRLLVREGEVYYEVLRAEGISHNELLAALRGNGCFSPREVDYAVLESSGTISVRALRDRPSPDDRRAQEEKSRARLAARQAQRERRSGAGGGSSAEGSSTGASVTRRGVRSGGARSGRPASRSSPRSRSA